jgi:hypothetical protein
VEELIIFENKTGEGIIAFEPWRTHGPEYDQDHSRWYGHLTVAGQRVFEYGCPCGTCGIVFRKIGSITNRISDSEAISLLGTLDTVPSSAVLQRLARALEPGSYYLTVIEGTVLRVEPGTPDDYFATDVVRLFGLENPDYKEPSSPHTTYYRLGVEHALERTWRRSGPHRALITAVVMPLHDPSLLNRERVDFWKQQFDAGVCLTAFAVSVIDNQSPAMDAADDTYGYKEQFLFTNCLLDGHHRIQAAAELGAPIRILAFVTEEFSLTQSTDDLVAVLRQYGR